MAKIPLILIGLMCSIFAASEGCSEAKVNKCMQPIVDLRHQLNIPDDIQYFPLYKLNDEGLRKYCRVGKQMGICLQQLRGCNPVDKEIIEGVVNSVKYICDEAIQDYKKHQTCYASRRVVSGMEGCLTKHKTRLAHTDSKDIQIAVCKAIKDQIPCVRDAIEPHCGTEAADLQVMYAKTVLDPLEKALGCNKLPTWLNILIYAGVGCAIGIVIYCIKFAIVMCRRPSGRKHVTTDIEYQPAGYIQPPTCPPPHYEQVKQVEYFPEKPYPDDYGMERYDMDSYVMNRKNAESWNTQV